MRTWQSEASARCCGSLVCSPSFNWRANLDETDIARFQRELGAMGYKYQFVTLAGFHSLNHAMFELSRDYLDRGMAAYSDLQEAEFASEDEGYTEVAQLLREAMAAPAAASSEERRDAGTSI